MERPVDESCLFCKIIAGSIPCVRVLETDDILAFLDISPCAKGHTLVVPKGHYPTLLDFPSELGTPLLDALRRVGNAVMEATGAGGFNCLQNNFAPAGQMVFHSHWHIVPRFEKDGIPDWPGTPYANPDEMEQLAQSIRAFMG